MNVDFQSEHHLPIGWENRDAAEFGMSQLLYWGGAMKYADTNADASVLDQHVFTVRQTAVGLGGAWINGIQLFGEIAVAEQTDASKSPIV